jgi:hypothetical protein
VSGERPGLSNLFAGTHAVGSSDWWRRYGYSSVKGDLRELGRRKGVPFATRGWGMYHRKVLQTTFGPGEIMLFAAASVAICFVAVLLLAN